jgi:hypothetical protein
MVDGSAHSRSDSTSPCPLLGDRGYEPDPGTVEQTADTITYYHYTHRAAVESITARREGLLARRPVACPSPPPQLIGAYLTEGFLEPLPRWLRHSPHFGDLGFALLRAYIGDVLLCIELPRDYPGLYVADYAHVLECKHVEHQGGSALGLGYDCRTGHVSTQAYVESYIRATEYRGGYLAPMVQVVRQGPGRTVLAPFIRVAVDQPLLVTPTG